MTARLAEGAAGGHIQNKHQNGNRKIEIRTGRNNQGKGSVLLRVHGDREVAEALPVHAGIKDAELLP